MKPKYFENTTDQSQVNDTFFHILLYRVHLTIIRLSTVTDLLIVFYQQSKLSIFFITPNLLRLTVSDPRVCKPVYVLSSCKESNIKLYINSLSGLVPNLSKKINVSPNLPKLWSRNCLLFSLQFLVGFVLLDF